MKPQSLYDLSQLYEARFGKHTPIPKTNFNYQSLGSTLDRRSVRQFANRPLPDGMLEVLLACAQSAPSKSDLQQYSIIRVEAADQRAAIADRIPSMPWIKQAASLLVFCGDLYRNRQMGEHHGLPNDNDNVDSFLNASVDCALAMQVFISSAERIGLGCCPISVVRNHIDFITELLALPEGVFPVAGLACGWPEGSAGVSQRLPTAAVVHTDRYQGEGLVDTVLDYDERRRTREPISADKQRHTKRYGVKENLGWSENIARQLSVAERDEFRTYLKRQMIGLS